MAAAETALDQVLAGYAAGTLPAPMQVLVEAHLALSDANRGFVRALEGLAGAEIAGMAPVALADADGMLARIVEASEAEPAAVGSGRGLSDPIVPAGIARLFGADFDALGWRTVLPGIREHRAPGVDGCDALLLHIEPGVAVPQHGHSGLELTLVLEGVFVDGGQRFVRGDLAVADEDVEHQPVVAPERDCLCFTVLEGPIRLSGPAGSLADR